jgi:D-Tyr-tRNAtyr deacylase
MQIAVSNRFAAVMDVELINDGPVTIVLDPHA